jgi:hypothetical protein
MRSGYDNNIPSSKDQSQITNLMNPLRAAASGMMNPPLFGTQSMIISRAGQEPNGSETGFKDRTLAHQVSRRQVQRNYSGRIPQKPSPSTKDQLDYLLEPPRRQNPQGPQSYLELAIMNAEAKVAKLRQAQQLQESVYGIPPPPLTPAERQLFLQQQMYRQKIDEFGKNPFIANMTKNPDLNLFERTAIGVQAMEIDGVRFMKDLPIGTDLYRYKLEQTKELGTMRAELLKVLDEIRLKGVKRRFEMLQGRDQKSLEDQMWADEQMKAIILKQLRKHFGKEVAMEMYDNANSRRQLT